MLNKNPPTNLPKLEGLWDVYFFTEPYFDILSGCLVAAVHQFTSLSSHHPSLRFASGGWKKIKNIPQMVV